jgi:hypothetical protein
MGQPSRWDRVGKKLHLHADDRLKAALRRRLTEAKKVRPSLSLSTLVCELLWESLGKGPGFRGATFEIKETIEVTTDPDAIAQFFAEAVEEADGSR